MDERKIIVKEKFSLLLKKSSLKKARTVHDIANDKTKVFDKDFNLYFLTSGHYCIDIFPIESAIDSTQEFLVSEKDLPIA